MNWFGISKYGKLTILMGIIILFNMDVHAQKERTKVDTLQLKERFSLRTNTIDWLLLIPNISAEFDLGNTNYNHWAIGAGIRYNWQTKHQYKPGVVYNLAELRAEARYYWRTQAIDSFVIMPHKKKNYFGRLISTRRFLPKHLKTTYYRGAYITADKYSFLLGETGYQGKAITAGFLYGIVKPLYEFENRNTLDLDIGFSIGLAYTTYDEYYHDRESDCYPVTDHKDWHLKTFPIVSELRFAFVYRFGQYPLAKKYRWRYDVDPEYYEKIRDIASQREKERKDKENMLRSVDDLENKFNEYYQLFYNDCLKQEQEKFEKQQQAEREKKESEKQEKKDKKKEKDE